MVGGYGYIIGVIIQHIADRVEHRLQEERQRPTLHMWQRQVHWEPEEQQLHIMAAEEVVVGIMVVVEDHCMEEVEEEVILLLQPELQIQ